MSSPYADQLKLGPSLWQYVCWIFFVAWQPCAVSLRGPPFLAFSLWLYLPEGTNGGTGGTVTCQTHECDVKNFAGWTRWSRCLATHLWDTGFRLRPVECRRRGQGQSWQLLRVSVSVTNSAVPRDAILLRRCQTRQVERKYKAELLCGSQATGQVAQWVDLWLRQQGPFVLDWGRRSDGVEFHEKLNIWKPPQSSIQIATDSYSILASTNWGIPRLWSIAMCEAGNWDWDSADAADSPAGALKEKRHFVKLPLCCRSGQRFF